MPPREDSPAGAAEGKKQIWKLSWYIGFDRRLSAGAASPELPRWRKHPGPDVIATFSATSLAQK